MTADVGLRGSSRPSCLGGTAGDKTVQRDRLGTRCIRSQVSSWKRQAIEAWARCFRTGRTASGRIARPRFAISRQDRPVDGGTGFFGRRAQAMSREERKAMIAPDHPALSVSHQCKLLSISRSSFYYAPMGDARRTWH